MHEKQWADERDNPRRLYLWLEQLKPARTKAGRRRFRLLACGITRLGWDDMTYDVSRGAVEVAERLADGLAGNEHLSAARSDAAEYYHDRTGRHWQELRTRMATYLALVCCDQKATIAAYSAIIGFPADDEGTASQRRSQELLCDLLRCVFGNPFQKPTFSKKWRTETVTALAAGIYEERAFDRLPILADALEEAGCDDPAMLSHLRGPGPHCRGCWVLDLALGK